MTATSPRLVCRILAVTVMVELWASLAGCASLGPVKSVAVSDVKSVSGTWKGIVYLPGNERNDVTVTIRDDGSYEALSVKQLGVSRGKGHILIRDGRLIIEGERGRGIGTVLRNSAGDVVMKVEMTLFDNSYLSAELVRVSDAAASPIGHHIPSSSVKSLSNSAATTYSLVELLPESLASLRMKLG